jgi:hypothetical protein
MTDWDRIWRGSGIGAVPFLVVGGVLYGNSPKVGASAEKLVSFYDGDRTRILIATVIFCIGFLTLLWFAAALSTDLRDAGKGGWGAAVTASSAALGAMLFARMTVRAALAFSIAGSGSIGVTSGLNDLAWALSVILFFSAAMLVMPDRSGSGGQGSSRKRRLRQGSRPWCSSCSAERPGPAMASGRPTVGMRPFRGSSCTCGSRWSAASSSCGGRLRPACLSERRCPRRSSERRGRRTRSTWSGSARHVRALWVRPSGESLPRDWQLPPT